MLISPEYLALQRELHARNPHYATSASEWVDPVYQIATGFGVASLLDYGSGKGLLGEGLFGKYSSPYALPFSFDEYDPAIDGKSERPQPADMVYCGDVLEHVEPAFLNDVLDDLQRVAQKWAMLVIATRPAGKTLADGRNAHLIVEQIDWWLPRLMARWKLWLCRDNGGEFLFIGSAI